MIKNKTYKLNKQLILTSEVLNSHVKLFWNDVFKLIQDDKKVKHLMVLCKVKYSEDSSVAAESFKTLGPLRRVEFNDLDLFNNYLSARLGILIDSYNSNSISEIIFTYVIREGEVSTEDKKLLEDITDKNITFHEFNKVNLPVSMDPSDYGTIRGKSQIDLYTRYFVINNNSNRLYEMDINFDQSINRVTVIGASKLKWMDTKLSDNSFKREIGKSTIYFLDGEIVLTKRELSAMQFNKSRS
jgi:hypothetical protein